MTIPTPYKPDVDCLAIAEVFGVYYNHARLLKALSYGIPVDIWTLGWAGNYSSRQVTHGAIERLRRAGFQINATLQGFVMSDDARAKVNRVIYDDGSNSRRGAISSQSDAKQVAVHA